MEVPTYDLPDEAIAQEPIEPRDAARLLVALDEGGEVGHRFVRDLPALLGPGDVVVVNDTRVIPARLMLTKASGGSAEVLLIEPLVEEQVSDGLPDVGLRVAEPPPNEQLGDQPGAGEGPIEPPSPPGVRRGWIALVRPGRRLPSGTVLFADGVPWVEVGERLDADGLRRVRLLQSGPLESVGRIALPPYIRRPLDDPERYQTVYARHEGSVAAPTAGLHLTVAMLKAIRARGVRVVSVDLSVGLGTFRPVVAKDAADHVMHEESYSVPEATTVACREAQRVVAIGTTTLRALETAAATGEASGRSRLYVHGDYPFAVVDVLLTNFHQPRSTLLLLLESFAGPRWRDLYVQALRARYRFLSFGDAMIVARRNVGTVRSGGVVRR